MHYATCTHGKIERIPNSKIFQITQLLNEIALKYNRINKALFEHKKSQQKKSHHISATNLDCLTAGRLNKRGARNDFSSCHYTNAACVRFLFTFAPPKFRHIIWCRPAGGHACTKSFRKQTAYIYNNFFNIFNCNVLYIF